LEVQHVSLNQPAAFSSNDATDDDVNTQNSIDLEEEVALATKGLDPLTKNIRQTEKDQ